MTQHIGFIGLGAMGDGMSRNLLDAGFTVRGFDARPEALERLTAAGGQGASTPAEAAAGADILVIVFTAAQAEAVLFGPDGAASTLPRGATVAMHTTMAPGCAACTSPSPPRGSRTRRTPAPTRKSSWT